MYPSALRMQKKQDKELVEHMLKMVGLEDFRKDYPHQLSGGMAQRVALVRSLINHPDILLLGRASWRAGRIYQNEYAG